MKVIITFTFCCDNLWKSKFMASGHPVLTIIAKFHYSDLVSDFFLVGVMEFGHITPVAAAAVTAAAAPPPPPPTTTSTTHHHHHHHHHFICQYMVANNWQQNKNRQPKNPKIIRADCL